MSNSRSDDCLFSAINFQLYFFFLSIQHIHAFFLYIIYNSVFFCCISRTDTSIVCLFSFLSLMGAFLHIPTHLFVFPFVFFKLFVCRYGVVWACGAYWYDGDGIIRVNVEEYAVELLLHYKRIVI